jgi:hypothetical protein
MDDNGKPFGFWRALGDAEFWLLLATAASGGLGLAWWVGVPLSVAGLSISSLPKYVHLWPKARELDAELVWWRTVGLSVLGTVAASVGAFIFGVASHALFATWK